MQSLFLSPATTQEFPEAKCYPACSAAPYFNRSHPHAYAIATAKNPIVDAIRMKSRTIRFSLPGSEFVD
jgi:hypothetical protein